MNDKDTCPIIDADSHILEPSDLWQKYLELEYRDRALRLEKDDKGWDQWVIDGKPWSYRHGVFGDMGAIGRDLEPHFTPGVVSYEEGIAFAPGGWDPKERLTILDKEDIDKVVLYPSLGITWEGGCTDPEMGDAYCRAYNNWLLDWCSESPDRLIPIAHVCLLDPELAAEEMKRAVAAGAKGIMLRAYPSGNRQYGDPANDRFWAQAEETGVPLALHIGGAPRMMGEELFDVKMGRSTWWIYVMFMSEVQLGFTTVMNGAVLERFPGIKMVLLESGCGWLPYWLDRMDDTFEHTGFSTALKLKPSEYFKRQCLVTMDADEELAAVSVAHVGAQSFMWAADYPHSDGHWDAVNSVRSTLKDLPEDDLNKVLGENARRIYGL